MTNNPNDAEESKISSDAKDHAPFMSEPARPVRKIDKQYSVSLLTLRYYESGDLFRPLHKGTTCLQRIQDCHRRKMALHGKRFGFSTAEIDGLL